MFNSKSCKLIDTTSNPNRFFDILPEDWQEPIVPVWATYRDKAQIFILLNEGRQNFVLGGGIIFKVPSPDTEAYEAEAQRWFRLGYLYLAWLWIDEQHRGKKLGSMWLSEILKLHPDQKFWLTIEDHALWDFYKKHGFQMVKCLEIEDGKQEWVLIYEPERKNSSVI